MSREEQIVHALLEWHRKNRRSFPWRDESDPYKILVAELFLQRTPAERVARIYPSFIEKYPDPQTLEKTNPIDLIQEYGKLGLSKRMTWLVESMKIICTRYNGRVPESKKDLMGLPGIGEYTASAIICFAFKQDVAIVDVNIVRLYSRVFNLDTREIKEKAEKIVSQNKDPRLNEALLDFSSLICKRNPLCYDCVLQKMCSYIHCS